MDRKLLTSYRCLVPRLAPPAQRQHTSIRRGRARWHRVDEVACLHGLAGKSATPWLGRSALAEHSVDWYAQSEDLPHPDSRVTVRPDGAINLHWHRSNMRAHQRWVAKCKQILRDTGYPIVLSSGFGTEVVSHQCGTVRFGNDPATSALDPYCIAWDHDNLYVVDTGFFPSSAAVNPALTLAAQALRVGQHLRQEFFA